MKVIVLGSISPYPKDYLNCPGYLVINGEEKILLDAGNGVSRLLKMPEDLNCLTIVISHFHKDHYADLFALAYASFVYHNLVLLEERIKVYLPNDDCLDLKLLLDMKEHYFDIQTYHADSNFVIGDTKISFMKTVHPILTFASKIENKNQKIVYSADTGIGVKRALTNFAKDVDLFICEASFIREHHKESISHLCAYESAEIAALAHVKQLLLTHFWPEEEKRLYLEEAIPIFRNTIVAQEKEIIDLDIPYQYQKNRDNKKKILF